MFNPVIAAIVASILPSFLTSDLELAATSSPLRTFQVREEVEQYGEPSQANNPDAKARSAAEARVESVEDEQDLASSDETQAVSFASFDLTLYAAPVALACGTMADPDCDGDGVPDDLEHDCDGNGVPDECEGFEDCDENGVPDGCDPDDDGNGVPNACEPVDTVADGDSTTRGFVSGSYHDTHADDGVTQAIQEEESGGSPHKRRSLLEHRWSFTVPDSGSATFFIRAHHTQSVDGDDFVFACATPGSGFIDMLTVTKIVDDGAYQSVTLPGAVGGTIYVRVMDTDRSRTDRELDTIFIDQMFIRTTSTALPPIAPTGLTASATSSAWIELDWADNSPDEDGFEIERSSDGTSFSQICNVEHDVTSYLDTGLMDSTTYYYRVRSQNVVGVSDHSNVASDTTPGAGASEDVADGETTTDGSITRGDHVDTGTANDVHEELREERTGGPQSSRQSMLEHTWTVEVQGGNSVELHVQAHHSGNGEGDDFVFAWSDDDASYTDLLTVTKTSDDGAYQVASLPALASGTVYIRVRDTDRTPGSSKLDTILVDHMFIRSQ
ncbi:MAG: hypothetical protein ACI8QZ_001386 [Chlamydiales bacterium]|jgi:hypothetical protein